ncbi:MAG: ATP-grasp fold amidoligase family protein [Pseudomonadota bacterium]
MTKRLHEQTPQALMKEAYQVASAWLAAEMDAKDSCFLANPKPNFGRGIEFYSGMDLYRLAAYSIAIYASGVGRWPDLACPVRLTEKQLWSKFFGYVPLPSPADKLGTKRFLPFEFRDRIRLPEVVWRSAQIAMPPGDRIPAGRYFLKANNDSGTNLELHYPLTPDQKDRLADWLRSRQGPARIVGGGEWWYARIKPEIFLERAIGSEGSPPEEWKLHVMNGRCTYLYEREGDGRKSTIHTVYDRDFVHLPVKIREMEIGKVRKPFEDFTTMVEAAEAIARNMSFARVDFYRTAPGELFLGEITLCPNNAVNWFSDPEFDEKIAVDWDHRFNY